MSDYKSKQLNELELWQLSKQGDVQARNMLLKSLDPLFKKNIDRYKNSGLPREYLETEARFLAAKAFESYDPSKAQLNTHVTNHLKHLQRSVIDFQNVAKIPENRAIAISKFKNIKSHLEDKLNREPNTIELADELNWSVAEVERMESEQRRDLTMISGEDIFYENSFDDRDMTLESIWYVYYDSDNLDKKILEYLFGLMGNPKLTVPEIAIKLRKPQSEILERYKFLADKIVETRDLV